MSKFNWDRVRNERNISRNGSDYTKNEREIYFRGNETLSHSSPQNHSQSQRQEVKTQQTAGANPSNFQQSGNTNVVEIKVGDNKDGRIRLPASMFTGKSGVAIVNGVAYSGNPGDNGRCKVQASVFGAVSGQTIRITHQANNTWTATIVGKSFQTNVTPKQPLHQTPSTSQQKSLLTQARVSGGEKMNLRKPQRPQTLPSKGADTNSYDWFPESQFPTPFSDKTLRDWFFDSFPPDIEITENISTMGCHPFEKEDLEEFFAERGLYTEPADEDTEVLVLGREDWDREDLNDLLDKRAGKRLRVYSQEMFLAFWMSNTDPLQNRKIALTFAQGHPGLEYLSEIGFDWVDTYVEVVEGGNFDKDLPIVGILKHLGYRVGMNGLLENERRKILRRVFTSELPTVVSLDYMEEWGSPNSKKRLQKMANSIAAFCRNEKRKSNPSEIAISEWEDDLNWLKKQFYTGRFMFQWPDV